MGRKPKVIKHISKEELEDLYRKEKDPRIKERLLAIIHLYEKKNIYEVQDILKKSDRTIKDWLSRWNNKGYEGLIPAKGGGIEPRISSLEWDNIIKEIEGKGMTVRDVMVYVKTTRSVDYSYNTTWKILRVDKGVKYGKPYIKNEKRPEYAEKILKKNRLRVINSH